MDDIIDKINDTLIYDRYLSHFNRVVDNMPIKNNIIIIVIIWMVLMI